MDILDKGRDNLFLHPLLIILFVYVPVLMRADYEA